MNWDDLRIVLALTRAGTLSAAARSLGLDRTTVARRLAGLEHVLGTRLLVRRGGAQRPTEAARAIGARAVDLEVAALGIARTFAAREARAVGAVRVTATEALGARLLAPALAKLAARHPGLRVDLTLEARTLSLARGEADLAVRLLAPTESTSVGLRLGSVAYGAYAARGRGRRRTPDGLLVWDEPIAGAETEWLRGRFPGAQERLRASSTAALAAAACAGAGVAVLPRFVGDAEPGLVRLEDGGEIPASPLWLVLHRDARRAARVSVVRDELTRVLAAARRALEGPPARGSTGSPRAETLRSR